MAKLGWGTPTLVSVSLGVIIEIPGNIAILGVLKVALPDEDAALLVLQVNFVGAIEFDKTAALLLRRALRLPGPLHDPRGRDGAAGRVGRRRQLRARRVGGFHPQLHAAAAAVPDPDADRGRHPQQPTRADPGRGLLRRHQQHRAVRRAGRAVSSASATFASRAPRLRRAVPVLAVLLHHRGLGVVVAEGVRRRAVQHPAADVAGGPAPWRAHGTRLDLAAVLRDLAPTSTSPGARRDDTIAAAGRRPAAAGRRARQAEGWGRAAARGATCWSRCAALEADRRARWCCTRWACCRIRQRAVPLDITIDKVGDQKPSDANRFSVSVAGGGLAKAPTSTSSSPPPSSRTWTTPTKLSRRAFEPRTAASSWRPTARSRTSTRCVSRTARYEQIIIDTAFKRPGSRFFGFIPTSSAISCMAMRSRGRRSRRRSRCCGPVDEPSPSVARSTRWRHTDDNSVVAGPRLRQRGRRNEHMAALAATRTWPTASTSSPPSRHGVA